MGNGKRKTGKRKHKMGNRNWKWNTDQSSPVVKIILYCFYFSLTHLYRTWNLVKLLNLSLETGQRLLQGERSSWDNSTDCSSSSSWETISSSIFNSLFPPPRGETFSCFQAYKFPLRTWFPHSLKGEGRQNLTHLSLKPVSPKDFTFNGWMWEVFKPSTRACIF